MQRLLFLCELLQLVVTDAGECGTIKMYDPVCMKEERS